MIKKRSRPNARRREEEEVEEQEPEETSEGESIAKLT